MYQNSKYKEIVQKKILKKSHLFSNSNPKKKKNLNCMVKLKYCLILNSYIINNFNQNLNKFHNLNVYDSYFVD